MISDFNISENKGDIIKIEDNVQYQMTTSDNQKNNTNKNMSTIDLGECEAKLKKIYDIDPSLPLIIFKIDYFEPGVSAIPIIGYEIYHPLNKSKLDLSYCKDILIKLNIPVNIDEDNLFKYDPNSDFYKDNCFSYTTENGTDIILRDRKQEFSDNKLSLCEKNCNYSGYNGDNKQSSCDCNIKNKMETISEIISNQDKLANSFNSEETESSSGSSNVISIKCTKALFSKDGLKSNISSYILIIFITYFLLSIVLFIKCGYPLLVNDMREIIHKKEKIEKLKKKNVTNLLDNRKQSRLNTNKNTVNKIRNRKTNYPPKKSRKLNFFNNSISNKNNNKNISTNKIKTSKNNINNNKRKNTQFNRAKTKNEENEGNDASNNKKKNKEIKMKYNDYELNTMDYNSAKTIDKRTCTEYYISLIKYKNAIIFSFCPRNDYNSIIIRSCIFNLSFSIYYAINFAFFTDEILHQIYEEGGKYNILYFMPKISISFFIAYYITTIIKIIFLSERNISEVRKQVSLSNAHYSSEKVQKNLVIKYIIFFILGLAFLVFFWMLLSSFGAVYPNTQIFIFKNTLISFAISLVYPFIISVFPCIFRMCSLNSKQNDQECVYKASTFMQIL